MISLLICYCQYEYSIYVYMQMFVPICQHLAIVKLGNYKILVIYIRKLGSLSKRNIVSTEQ